MKDGEKVLGSMDWKSSWITKSSLSNGKQRDKLERWGVGV